MFFIYKITNDIDELVYIGSTNNLKARWGLHRSYAKHSNFKLYRHIRQIGLEHFKIEAVIEFLQEPDKSTILQLEQAYIDYYRYRSLNTKRAYIHQVKKTLKDKPSLVYQPPLLTRADMDEILNLY